MIPAFLITRYGPRVAAFIFWGGVAIVAALLLAATYFAVSHFFTSSLKETVAVQGRQIEAQGNSAHDAIQTQGNVAANEQASDELTRENANVIDHANGSDAAVAPDARAAGLSALCARASFRAAHPACVQ